MNSPATVRFNDPPVTEYNSMDVDESTVSRMSTDQLNLGPANDPESCSVSSNGPEVFSSISDHSPPAQCDQPGLPVHLDLYLGPEDDLMAGMHDQSLLAQPDMPGLAIHLDLYLRPDEDIMTEIPDLYLGPDEDFMPEFPDKSLPAQPDQLGFPIHPDMYLGPEDDLIDCEVKQECADSDSEVSGAPVVSRAFQSIQDRVRITNSDTDIFPTHPSNNYSRLRDHSELPGQKHLTNSEELMKTSRGCKELNI
ncbi:uncharacterized protein EDB93DRAFT_1102998 [Suillus bovinus]|uniref:uncharacterized protein n=1 Tax=Suillus bovinus TaxID=48563 RepID=UPI001B871155|nr:uncharacterized protein EDB93DRAFT_1102998 [Suillus bovinus]KAG2151547.1 hypothetical protein EDB93DRAFT_1102998 [Suillus bovinus]